MSDLRIGTSGWFYDHWRGRFYPEDLPKTEWFGYYARHFDTVELNNTFYHLPRDQTLKRWHKLAPKDFLFAVKASRYITHIKKLRNVKEELQRFFDMATLLKGRLGPVLYQLPPSMGKDMSLLKEFLKLLPGKRRAVFEFRNRSWYCDDTYEFLDKSDAGFCIHDLGELATPRIITGHAIYIRFHGASGRYAGNYPTAALRRWADWIRENMSKVTAVYAYFNNDAEGHAIANARTLMQVIGLPRPTL